MTERLFSPLENANALIKSTYLISSCAHSARLKTQLHIAVTIVITFQFTGCRIVGLSTQALTWVLNTGCVQDQSVELCILYEDQGLRLYSCSISF